MDHHLRTKAIIALLVVLIAGPAAALTLQEGLQIVTEQGRDAAIARSGETVAREAVSLAAAPRFPSLDLYARETWLRDQPGVRFGPSGITAYTSEDQFLTYGFRATQVLYDFGRTSSHIAAAEESLRAREASTLRARNRAALAFIAAYFDLLEANDLLKVAEDEVARYEAHRRDTEVRLQAGAATRSDLLQAEVPLADSKLRLLNAENALAIAASRVNSILVRPLNDSVNPTEIVGDPLEEVTLEVAWAAAESGNPELRDLDARIRAQEAGVRAVRTEYLPTITLSGGYEYTQNQYQIHEDNWMVVAAMHLNLFSGGATASRTGMARGMLASLRLERERLLDAVRLAVQAAWLDLQTSRRKVNVSLAAVAQADENLRLQRLRYQAGAGTATEVLDAVTLLTAAETNAWKAGYGVRRAEAALFHAMGRDLAAAYAAAR